MTMNKNELAEAYFRSALDSYKEAENHEAKTGLEFYKYRMEKAKTQAFWILSTIEAYEKKREDLRKEYYKTTNAIFY